MSGAFTHLRKTISPLRRLTPGAFNQRSFLFHLHPALVSREALRPSSTLGLGLVGLVLFFILFSSGLLLMIYYLPTPSDAYASIQDIQYTVSFGAFTRALHRCSAHALVAIAALHFLRVLFCAGYQDRLLNWFVGLCLGLITLSSAYTGGLLPWDQNAYWTSNIVANLLENIPIFGSIFKSLALGGNEVNQTTLVRFYVLHVALLPSIMFGLLIWHVWRIRKDGGLAISTGFKPNLPSYPHLIIRELTITMVVVAVMCIISITVEAPLDMRADPHIPSNPEKAPWYFLWLQEMVSYSPLVGGVCFPAGLLLTCLILPFADPKQTQAGKWLLPKTNRKVIMYAACIATVGLTGLYMIQIEQSMPSTGFFNAIANPAAGMLLLAVLAHFVFAKKAGSTRYGILAALIILMLTLVGCTLIGFCRGPDWIFYWPWEDWSIGS